MLPEDQPRFKNSHPMADSIKVLDPKVSFEIFLKKKKFKNQNFKFNYFFFARLRKTMNRQSFKIIQFENKHSKEIIRLYTNIHNFFIIVNCGWCLATIFLHCDQTTNFSGCLSCFATFALTFARTTTFLCHNSFIIVRVVVVVWWRRGTRRWWGGATWSPIAIKMSCTLIVKPNIIVIIIVVVVVERWRKLWSFDAVKFFFIVLIVLIVHGCIRWRNIQRSWNIIIRLQ